MYLSTFYILFFFFNDTATTEIYTLSLHDALPILTRIEESEATLELRGGGHPRAAASREFGVAHEQLEPDRKSTRLNSSHSQISYAVFCLKKKKKIVSHLSQVHCSLTQE